MAQSQINASWQDKLKKVLNQKNIFTEQLEKIEQKTGVQRLYIVIGAAAVFGLYLMLGYGAQFLCNFMGFVYPAYASVKAIESKEKNDDTKWLTYWVVYSGFSLIEFFADIFLFWVPFYWFFKCLFLVYCMVPTSWNGSLTIYDKVIRPFVLKNQERIDKALGEAANMAGELASEAQGLARDAAKDATKAVIDSKLD
jgi:receptor expression-enhancing protein 5/6